MVFCNFLEIKAEAKKVVGVKVVSFGVLYSCVKFRRLKMGDPVYNSLESKMKKSQIFTFTKKHCRVLLYTKEVFKTKYKKINFLTRVKRVLNVKDYARSFIKNIIQHYVNQFDVGFRPYHR